MGSLFGPQSVPGLGGIHNLSPFGLQCFPIIFASKECQELLSSTCHCP